MNDYNTPRLLLMWVAIITLITGLGIGFAALSASLGVWLGLWSFGTGFQILGSVNPYTGTIAVGCLIVGVILFLLAKALNTGASNKSLSLAFIGALGAGIAWYIPTTFQAPEGQNFPPIHDVSTDLISPLEYVDVLPLRVDAPNTVIYGGSQNMTAEKNAELQAEAYPNLVPVFLDISEAEAFSRAMDAVDDMGWELVASVPEEGRIEATATTFWFRFKDDVVIRIRPEAGKTRIDARSLSRVGGGDAGANAKRLLKLFAIL